MSAHTEIRSHILRRKPGLPFSAQDLRRFGNPGTVYMVLSRLVRERVARRIGWGLYVAASPAARRPGISAAELAAAVARSKGERVQVTGAEAVYRLGLTTDRPRECLYLTSGPSKRVKAGAVSVELQHDFSPAMLGAGTQAGIVLAALRHLGPDGITARDLVTIRRKITRATARQLRRYRPLVPEWMRDYVDALTAP